MNYEGKKEVDNKISPFKIDDRGVIVGEFSEETDFNRLINAIVWAIHEDYREEIK